MLGAVGRALGPKPREYLIAGNGFNPAAFQIFIAPVERLLREGQLIEKFSDNVLDKLVTPASGLSRHPLQLR